VVNNIKAVDIWKYDPILDIWTKENIDLKGLKHIASVWRLTKVVDDEVYILFLDYNMFPGTPRNFVFDTKTNSFRVITNLLQESFLQGSSASFVADNKLYVWGLWTSIYYYDKTTNKWEYTPTNILQYINYGIGFEIGNLGFVGLGESNQLYEFDPTR